jgi:integrase
MKKRLTDRLVLSLPPPLTDQAICWDTPNGKGLDHTSGFGVRVTSGGARAYFLDYRNSSGRQRRLTIGSPPAWTTAAARDQAAELRRRIDAGSDPLAELETERTAPTICDLAERFEKDELPKRRVNTQYDYSAILRRHILPRLGKLKVAQVSHADIEKLHRQIAATAPYRANRTVAVLSRMLNLAIKWQLRPDNPAKGIERRPEERRERYLSPAQLVRLAEVLALRPGPSANAVRLLLLTGARRNEVRMGSV